MGKAAGPLQVSVEMIAVSGGDWCDGEAESACVGWKRTGALSVVVLNLKVKGGCNELWGV